MDVSVKSGIFWIMRSCILVEVSEERTATIFKVEEQSNNQQ
jgi:hypothetical protein